MTHEKADYDVVCRTTDNDDETQTLYALQDPNWNVVAVLNANGSVAERMTYDSFGKPTFRNANFTAKTASSYGWSKTFTGQVYDVETGLLLYRNRYYHTGLGRFITRDPIGYNVDEISLYRYVFNQATLHIDPMGYWGADVHNGLTRIWLKDILPSDVANAVASADEATDDFWPGKGPYPIRGTQAIHFNRNPDGYPDSRFQNADNALAQAVYYFCHGFRRSAWEYLGQTLHAVQDYYAHGDYGRGNLSQDIWTIHNNGGPKIPGKGDATGYPDLWGYDAVGSADGRPTATVLKTVTSVQTTLAGGTCGPYETRSIQTIEYAEYKPGEKRSEETERKTKEYVTRFIDTINKTCKSKANDMFYGSIRPR